MATVHPWGDVAAQKPQFLSTCRRHASAQFRHRPAGRSANLECHCSFSQGAPVKEAVATSRRSLLAGGLLCSGTSLLPLAAASASFIEDALKRNRRPELQPEQALIMLLDARSTLYELKGLAETAENSRERFEARRLLPGMAKRLREAGMAAPVVATSVTGRDRETAVSVEYGGQGDQQSITSPVYSAIGQVITISGRTIRKEAQASPAVAENAIKRIDDLIALLPKGSVESAEKARISRQRQVA